MLRRVKVSVDELALIWLARLFFILYPWTCVFIVIKKRLPNITPKNKFDKALYIFNAPAWFWIIISEYITKAFNYVFKKLFNFPKVEEKRSTVLILTTGLAFYIWSYHLILVLALILESLA